MKPNVTEFDFIEGAFSLLPKENQHALFSVVAAMTKEAEKTSEAQQRATRKAAHRWREIIFNTMEDDDWEEFNGWGYDPAFLLELKEIATRYNAKATQAPAGCLSEWEDMLYVYAFRKGMEVAGHGY